MKKSVILSILGIAGMATYSYGQGAVDFDTYDALPGGTGILTTYGNGPLAGGVLPSSFTAELLWSATAVSDSATTAATVNNAPNSALSAGISTPFASNGASAGFIVGGNLNLTSGQIGSGAEIWLEVVAYNGTGWGSATTTYQGHSAVFTSTVASGLTLPTAQQMNNLVPFEVFQTIPEPTTMALGGLGLASLLLFRRKQV